MKKLNIKALSADLLMVINRFYVVLFFVFTLAVLSFFEINDNDFELEFNYWGGIILSALIAVSVVFYREISTLKWSRLASYLSLILVAIYGFYFFNHKIEWETMQFAAFMVAAILLTFVVLYFRKNSDAAFWIFAEKNVRELITTMIYISILFGGLSLAVYAVDVLFEVNVSDKVYANLSVICYLIVAPVYFLMNVPPKADLYKENPDYGKFLKILGLYVFLPVLGIYLVILYFYLFKIIIRWELPNGWVTTLVSVLALGGYVAKFLLFPVSDNKVVGFLNRWFSLLLFPLIVLMSVGLARRIADYGISINRLYVLVFNVWLYGVSIYLFLTQSKHLRWLVISFAAVLFLVSVGPWSVFALTKRSVEKELTTLMVNNKLFVNEKVVENKDNKLNISDTIASQISDKTYYYVQYFGIEQWKSAFNFKKKIVGSYELTELLGVNNFNRNERSKYIDVRLSENRQYDIKGYSKVLMNLEITNDDNLIFKNNDFKIEISGNVIFVNDINRKAITKIPLSSIVSQLYQNDEDDAKTDKLLTYKLNNCMLLINRLSANCKTATDFQINNLEMTLFVE